jgi:pimeloyl-ACP methyl ester carboxylesterase
MPAVFVHGVPDTERVWNALVSRLDRDDVVTLSLPGFGCPVPNGFDATKEAYVEWLLGELAAMEGPIDIVGHDWGALLVIRAASLRPELVRSWAMGGAPVDAEYVWHQAARIWQTPEAGEQFMEAMTPDAIRAALAAGGVSETDAEVAVAHIDETMKRCILPLYRSAVSVGAEWEGDLGRLPSLGLVLWGEKDIYVAPSFGERLAARTGAKYVCYPGCSHWWELDRPDEVAAELQALWATAKER